MGKKYGSQKDSGIFLKPIKRTRGWGYLVNALIVPWPWHLSVSSVQVWPGPLSLLGLMDSSSCCVLGVILEMLMHVLLGFAIACLGDWVHRLLGAPFSCIFLVWLNTIGVVCQLVSLLDKCVLQIFIVQNPLIVTNLIYLMSQDSIQWL